MEIVAIGFFHAVTVASDSILEGEGWDASFMGLNLPLGTVTIPHPADSMRKEIESIVKFIWISRVLWCSYGRMEFYVKTWSKACGICSLQVYAHTTSFIYSFSYTHCGLHSILV